MSNQKILDNFPKLLLTSGLVNASSLVNVDFSTFCGFETLSFGVQTNSGRAIPIWANCITYPILEPGSQNIFVIDEIKKLGEVLEFYPRFVFDRGFWIPNMIKFFLKEEITFYLRIKKGQMFEWREGKKTKAIKIGKITKDTNINLYGHQLRLIISPPPKLKKHKKQERWYILTNDLTSSRETVLDIYRHRFEIEETFKDLKHICDLKKFFIKEKLTFRILLMFASLAFWIANWCRRFTGLAFNQVNPKKKRSYFKIWWETLQRELRQQSLIRIQKVWSG